jgi:hypothetical protein
MTRYNRQTLEILSTGAATPELRQCYTRALELHDRIVAERSEAPRRELEHELFALAAQANRPAVSA